MTMALPRSLPWWGWLLIVIGFIAIILLSVAIIVRQQGWHALQATEAELRRDGQGVTPVDLVASAPAVDAARQERAWALLGTGGFASDLHTTTWGMKTYAVTAKERENIDRETIKLLADTEALRRDWRALRADGPVTLSALGWIRQDFPHPEKASISDLSRVRFPSLLVERTLASALATEARTAADPGPALAELDSLVTACAPTGSLIDVFIAMAIGAIRDDAWLQATTVNGTDPGPWAAIVPPLRTLLADGFAHERMLFAGAMYQDLVAGHGNYPAYFGLGLTPPTVLEALKQWSGRPMSWVIMPGDVAYNLRGLRLCESICRTGTGDVAAFQHELAGNFWRHPTATVSLPNLMECGISTNQFEATARRVRLAAMLAFAYRRSGHLPANTRELSHAEQALAAATIFTPEIRYERVTPTRFRLWSDPLTSAMPLLPVGRIDAPKPTSASWNGGKGWWLELDLKPEIP